MSKYLDDIKEILGSDADSLLNYTCWGIPTEMLTPPSPDFVDHLAANTNRPIPVLRSLQTLFDTGRLKGTGYLSILPVDQGVEHSAGASFALNPIYFDPEHIVRLALEAECSAVVSTLGVLGSVARKYAH
ncbi:MAG: fructose-bisphosphate aldolase, partial [Aminobacterium sp.]|nr:fructose-bisphosphate aldolase [Aminobacterium sp.]